MEAIRQIENPAYNGIIFRRVFPSLEQANGIIHRSQRWYPSLGGVYNWAHHFWTFPSGAKIFFGHMQHESSKYLYQGAEFSFIGFDELTEFTETQYTYMFTRLRSPGEYGLRSYIRACTNPGNVGHLWVKQRFITRDIANRIRYFARVNGEDTEVPRGYPLARSRVFYPAKLDDNPSLGEEYLAGLWADPDAVQRARLIEGDWDAEYNTGLVYGNFSSQQGGNISSVEYDPNLPIIWGADDGYARGQGPGSISYHPRVILSAQPNALGGLNIIDEYAETGVSDYQETIRDVLAMGPTDDKGDVIHPYPQPEVVYIDSSAAMFSGTLWNMGFDVVKATHQVSEGVRNVRRMVCDENQMRLIQINPRCQNLIYEFSRYRFSETAMGKHGEPVPLKQDDHGMDALRYAAWHLRYDNV